MAFVYQNYSHEVFLKTLADGLPDMICAPFWPMVGCWEFNYVVRISSSIIRGFKSPTGPNTGRHIIAEPKLREIWNFDNRVPLWWRPLTKKGFFAIQPLRRWNEVWMLNERTFLYLLNWNIVQILFNKNNKTRVSQKHLSLCLLDFAKYKEIT